MWCRWKSRYKAVTTQAWKKPPLAVGTLNLAQKKLVVQEVLRYRQDSRIQLNGHGGFWNPAPGPESVLMWPFLFPGSSANTCWISAQKTTRFSGGFLIDPGNVLLLDHLFQCSRHHDALRQRSIINLLVVLSDLCQCVLDAKFQTDCQLEVLAKHDTTET